MNWKSWLLACLAAAPGLTYATALTLDQGELLLTPYALYYQTEHIWDRQGQRRQNHNRFKRVEGGLNVQYGLTERDTLSLWGAYDAIYEELDGNSYGFTDVELSWKRQLWRTSTHAIAAQVTTIIPTGNGYKPAIRYGQWGLEGSIHDTYALDLWGRRALMHSSLGYRWYEGYPSDQLLHRLAFCIPLYGNLSLRIGSAVDFGLFNGRSRLDQSLVWLNPNYRLWKGEAALVLRVRSQFYFSLGCFQHFLGQNVGTSGGLQGALTAIF